MDPNLSVLYRQVIDDVLQKTRENVLIGLDEHSVDLTIQRLMNLWESKLISLRNSGAEEKDLEKLEVVDRNPNAHSVSVKTENGPEPYMAPPSEVGADGRSRVSGSKLQQSSKKVEGNSPSIKETSDSGNKDASLAPVISLGSKRGSTSPDRSQTKRAKKEEEEEEEEEEEDDFTHDIVSDEDEEKDTENVILCQYAKVQRTKNRWKCTLRDGMMRIRGRDMMFRECTGEFEF